MNANLLSLECLNQAKKNPSVLPSSPIQIWGKSVPGFMNYDRTMDIQINKQIAMLYIYVLRNPALPGVLFIKVDPLNFSRVSLTKFEANWSLGSWVMIWHLNRQTDYYFIDIKDFFSVYFVNKLFYWNIFYFEINFL